MREANAPVTPLTITLFGGFEMSLGDGLPVTLAQRKAQALLAYLAVPTGQFRAREDLATLLWGDAADADARNSLRQTLFLIRRALPGAGADHLTVRRDAIALEPTTVRIDVRRFERRIAQGTLEALEGALTLYRGDFLQGFALDEPGFDEWMNRERERLRDLVRVALTRLLARHTDDRRFERALEVGRRLLALDPIDEPTHRALMRLHARRGHHAAALRQYQLCVSVLDRELAVEPDAETRELYRALVRERAVAPPVTMAGESDVAETPLIGRDTERRRLEDAVAVGGRGVIAILGDAGIGKTRLTRELAAIATAAGAHVIVGRCHDAERILPFRPWVEALRNGGLLKDHDALAKLAPVWRVELARLFPEIAPAGASPSASDENVLQLFEALVRLILDATVRGRLTIVLDDLQWADEMSLRFLSFLAHRIEDWPILVAVTARDEETDGVPLLTKVLRDLDREGRLLRLALVPLGRTATNTLVAALAPSSTGDAALAALAHRVWAVSEGNPFVAVEMMRAARTLDTLPELPHRVQDLIVGRLERLSEPASEMAALAAVIGGVFAGGAPRARAQGARVRGGGPLAPGQHRRARGRAGRRHGRAAVPRRARAGRRAGHAPARSPLCPLTGPPPSSARRRLPARRELVAAAEGFRGLGMKSYVDRTETALGHL